MVRHGLAQPLSPPTRPRPNRTASEGCIAVASPVRTSLRGAVFLPKASEPILGVLSKVAKAI